MKKITIQDIQSLKNQGSPFATITAYDYLSAQIVDEANIPLILVGDSASMTIYGYSTTVPISMSEMLLVTKAVMRGVKYSLVVADMPFLSYQPSIEETIKNAGILIKNGGAHAVKLEGGKNMSSRIKALVDVGIPVLAHIGLMPQSVNQTSGYSIQGKTNEAASQIIEDAFAVQEAGAFGVVLECIPESLATDITNKIKIPTIGIGSGNTCDGQIQVFHDIMGLSKNKAPKHAKQQLNLYEEILHAVKKYKEAVKKSK